MHRCFAVRASADSIRRVVGEWVHAMESERKREGERRLSLSVSASGGISSGDEAKMKNKKAWKSESSLALAWICSSSGIGRRVDLCSSLSTERCLSYSEQRVVVCVCCFGCWRRTSDLRPSIEVKRGRKERRCLLSSISVASVAFLFSPFDFSNCPTLWAGAYFVHTVCHCLHPLFLFFSFLFSLSLPLLLLLPVGLSLSEHWVGSVIGEAHLLSPFVRVSFFFCEKRQTTGSTSSYPPSKTGIQDTSLEQLYTHRHNCERERERDIQTHGLQWMEKRSKKNRSRTSWASSGKCIQPFVYTFYSLSRSSPLPSPEKCVFSARVILATSTKYTFASTLSHSISSIASRCPRSFSLCPDSPFPCLFPLSFSPFLHTRVLSIKCASV